MPLNFYPHIISCKYFWWKKNILEWFDQNLSYILTHSLQQYLSSAYYVVWTLEIKPRTEKTQHCK